MRSVLGAVLPIWPGLDTTPRLERVREESRKASGAMATKRVVSEMLYGYQGKANPKR